jgi:hypothetical protein
MLNQIIKTKLSAAIALAAYALMLSPSFSYAQSVAESDLIIKSPAPIWGQYETNGYDQGYGFDAMDDMPPPGYMPRGYQTYTEDKYIDDTFGFYGH